MRVAMSLQVLVGHELQCTVGYANVRWYYSLGLAMHARIKAMQRRHFYLVESPGAFACVKLAKAVNQPSVCAWIPSTLRKRACLYNLKSSTVLTLDTQIGLVHEAVAMPASAEQVKFSRLLSFRSEPAETTRLPRSYHPKYKPHDRAFPQKLGEMPLYTLPDERRIVRSEV